MEESNEHLRQAILEVVDNQILQNNPKETQETFKRLLEEGYSEIESKELIGAVVSTHIFEILKHNKKFDETKYVSQLKKLPEMPWE